MATDEERAQQAVGEFEDANEELFKFMDDNEGLFREMGELIQEYNDTLIHAQKSVQGVLDADPNASRKSIGIIGFRREHRKKYKGELLYNSLAQDPELQGMVVKKQTVFKVIPKELTRLERQGEISAELLTEVTEASPRIVKLPGGPVELSFKPIRVSR